MLTPEQKCLLDRAAYTWLRRGEAKAAGLPFGEETVTETVLLDLKLSYPGKIAIIPFNKRQEGRIGADWEWCFVSHDEQWSLPMLVQAKVLNDTETAYDHIARTIGNTGKRQIDQLLETALRRGIPAAYAFYNHLNDPSSIPLNCMSLDPNAAEQVLSWGISIADAQDVRDLLPDQSFAALRHWSHPLHCLLCTRGQANLGAGGSPALIADRMQRDMGASSGVTRSDWSPRAELPGYYQMIEPLLKARIGADRTAKFGAEVREVLEAANPDIDGLVVILDRSEDKKRD